MNRSVTDLGSDLDEGARQYLADLQQSALSTSLEKQRLAGSDEETKRQCIEMHLGLVVSVAKKYVGRGLDFLDLVQEGNLGLMKAVERFADRKGHRFRASATWWIERSIALALCHQVPPVSVEPIETILMDTISDDCAEPEEFVCLQELRADLYRALAHLTERERQALMLRYGLDGSGDMRTFVEVGCLLHISSGRVRQLEVQALRRLRYASRSAGLEHDWIKRSA